MCAKVFGFVPNSKAVADMTLAERETNASALSSALLYSDYTSDPYNNSSRRDASERMLVAAAMILPWIPCFVVYSMMHWTYPRDRDAYQAEVRARGGEP